MRRRAAVDTTVFYVPPCNIVEKRVILPEDEARHLARVLRIPAGETITVVDGLGGRHAVMLDAVDKRSAVGRIVETIQDGDVPPYTLTLAVGILKQASRYEMLVEKATELGVHQLVPLISARTQKRTIRVDRLQQIAIAAMKQSGRSLLLRVTAPLPWASALEFEGARYICHEGGAPESSLIGWLVRDRAVAPRQVSILVGPEGGFTDEEVEAAVAAGYEMATLGPRRLRAETAGITAAAAVMLANTLRPSDRP